MDTTYGVYFGDNNILMLGNSPVTFDNDDIFLNDIKYAGTHGLYDLFL